MKSTLTAAILIALGTSLPAVAQQTTQLTDEQLERANAACKVKGRVGASGKMQTTTKEGKIRVKCSSTKLPSNAEKIEKARTSAGNSASPLYAFIAAAVLGGVFSTSSTNSTAP